ncbi:MAG TPA: class I mannose-6-phosphate isomerase [Actinomycetota bacterium]|nr:class I mannose-6-phosphate isomerase [Actinomycetota bacterium]
MSRDDAAPFLLDPNPIERFYRGGPAIAGFRGIDVGHERTPEDWVGSCTCVFGQRDLGLSPLPDGRRLRDAIHADPVGYLGEEHVASFGPDPALLVKLLDADERLPVHWHPDRAFAREHLRMRFGKTEAWAIVEAREGAVVHLGFDRDVERAEVECWLREQDVDAMLGAMHRRPVRAGDAILVPAGTPHAIGEGILLVELQEPTDLSVLLEWRGFDLDGERDGHLGLGFDVALGSLRLGGVPGDELDRWMSSRDGGRLFPAEADAFFRADRVEGPGVLDAAFSIVVVLDGQGRMRWSGGELAVRRGATVLVPFAAGEVALDGEVRAIRCRPAERAPEPLPA